MDNNQKVKEYVCFHMHKSLVNLYKKYLILIEDLREDHESMIYKISNTIDEDTLKKLDYFDDLKYNYLRKKILDIGNETIREIEKSFDFIKMEFEDEKK